MINEQLRIDKNVAFNVLEFKKFEDRQTQIIIKSLLIYFSFSYQTDLFGYGTLDPYDFAKTMNIDKDSLFRAHPNPKQLTDSRNPEQLIENEKLHGKFSRHRIWDSYLENAIYTLSTTPLFESYNGSDENNDIVGVTNYILIRDRRVMAPKRHKGRTQKLYYQYILDDMFERNLRRYFLQTNMKGYLIAKKKNIEDFYLHVRNLYTTYSRRGTNVYRWRLDDLCVFFGVNTNLEAKYIKRKINVQLKKAYQILSNEIEGLKFDWEQGQGQKWKYVPTVKWNQIRTEDKKKADEIVLGSVFFNHLKRNLYEVFTVQNPQKATPEGFYRWLISKESNNDKVFSYSNIFLLHFQRPKYPSLETYANRFTAKLNSCGSTKEAASVFQAEDRP